jgi:hypothetical protein
MIQYEPGLVATSVGVAIAASFAALWLFTHLGTEDTWQMRATRIGAAFVMGLAICGMHYIGMAASRFAANSYCINPGIGGSGMDSRWLALVIATLTLGLLAVTTILLVYDAHLESNVRRYNEMLEQPFCSFTTRTWNQTCGVTTKCWNRRTPGCGMRRPMTH